MSVREGPQHGLLSLLDVGPYCCFGDVAVNTSLFNGFRCLFLAFSFLSLMQSHVALADETGMKTVSEELLNIPELSFEMRAPAGWKVRQNYRGQTLVFEDPMPSILNQTEFTRNITVAVQSHPAPIDAEQVTQLTQKLESELGSSVSDFQIIEARIIDYRDHDHAILVYTAFTQSGVPMRQMHVFTSGATQSALLTFTDLGPVFETAGKLDAPWKSLMSAELQGSSPNRYAPLIWAGSGLAALWLAAFLGNLYRRRQARLRLLAEDDSDFDESEESQDDEKLLISSAGENRDWQYADTVYAG